MTDAVELLTDAKIVKSDFRSGFKTSDQVQGPRGSGITYLILKRLRYASSVRPIEKAQHTWVCEHLPEACNAAIGP